MSMRHKFITEQVKAFHKIVCDLETKFPKRKFTLDGHLVSSLGVAYAVWLFDLEFSPPAEKKYDAESSFGRVQIKTTQKNSISARSKPDHLIALQMDAKRGSFRVVFNGPASVAWKRDGEKKQTNGHRQWSVSALQKLQRKVATNRQLSVQRSK